MKSKHIFEEHKELIEDDVVQHKAHVEKIETKFQGCTHKKSYIKDGKLRCPCGAQWQGRGIEEIHRLLTNSV